MRIRLRTSIIGAVALGVALGFLLRLSGQDEGRPLERIDERLWAIDDDYLQ